MKKNIAMIVTGILAAGVLTACGSAKSEDAVKSQTTSAVEAETETAAEPEKESAETTVSDTSKTVNTSTGKFTVGFDQEFPPMGFVGNDGQYTGFDLVLAEEVANRLGLEFVAQPINWDSKDMELDSGNIDCIWNGFTMQGREDNYTWVGPYMANEQVFVVTDDSEIKTKADLAGKAVEVQKDSSGLNAINEDSELLSTFGSLTEVADYNTALMDLESGACDAVCMDSIVAGYQIKSSGKAMKILDDTLAAEDYGIGFKKGNDELAQAVSDTLKTMSDDGTIEKISNDWFGSNVFVLK